MVILDTLSMQPRDVFLIEQGWLVFLDMDEQGYYLMRVVMDIYKQGFIFAIHRRVLIRKCAVVVVVYINSAKLSNLRSSHFLVDFKSIKYLVFCLLSRQNKGSM